MAVSFDLFGTLIVADRPEEPATELAESLKTQGVRVPDDWAELYWKPHLDRPKGAETPLDAHIGAILDGHGVAVTDKQIERAIEQVFAPSVETVPGALDVVAWADNRGPIAVCSNCSIPGLVERALDRSAIDRTVFDTVVSSAACGWRKPHPIIFQTVAARLDVEVGSIYHVGDTADADGGIEAIGGQAIILETGEIGDLPDQIENR